MQFQSYAEKTKFKKILGTAAVLLFALGGLYFYYIGSKNIAATVDSIAQSQPSIVAVKENQSSTNTTTSVTKTDTGNVPATLMPQSENYRMKEIAFGGYEASTNGEGKNVPLQINSVRSEVLTSRDGQEAKLLISWKTNKLAKSDIVYSRGGAEQKILSEDGPGFSHAMVIEKFDFATRYGYFIKATGMYGDQMTSDNFVAYTGQKNASVVELIISEFKKMFSWAKV